jgi:tRNA(Met) cytidine acetyltransferase
MPAIDMITWIKELLGQLNRSRQRQLVVLRGPLSWCDAGFAALTRLPTPMLVLSNRRLGDHSIPFSKAETCLGSESGLVVLDLFTGFNPDVLCIAAGLVRAQGVLVLLSPASDDWQPQADRYAVWQDHAYSARPRFADYFFAAMAADDGIGLLVTPEAPPATIPGLPVLHRVTIEQGITREQDACLRRIEQWLAGGATGMVLIRAQRGRGKSSCLGLLINRLQANYRILVCADSRRGAAALLRRAPRAEFVAPDRLLLDHPPADLVVVDEAAMIPGSLLRQINRLYPRLVMATTTGGYEGTGQGFMLRFVAAFDPKRLLQLQIADPVRWCPGDRLEIWLNRVLMLDIEAEPEATEEDPAAVKLQLVEDPGAPEFFDRLQQVYRLLSSAHYRTRPSDLRMLMENPDLVLLIASCCDRVVGAALLNREGGFDAALGEQIFLGRRRPKGHLLAQMLTAQAGIAHFAEYRGLRVQRIAVSEAWRRRGLGTRLLERSLKIARAARLDYVGASFALDAQTASFWQRAGFMLAHVSYAQGKSSGNHSIAVLTALQPKVVADLRQLRDRIERQLPAWMTQFLQVLDAAQVAALLRYTGFAARLSELEQGEIEAFAHGSKGFELCFVSLQKFVMQSVARSRSVPDALLIEKAVQNRRWQQLERENGGEGRKQLQNRLRALVVAELKAC